MPEKPNRASDYPSGHVESVRSACLYVATKLGDLMDEVVVVGGLVPSLLVEQTDLQEGVQPHVGTMDLDIGLRLTLLDEGRYRKLSERLRDAGFTQDETEEGRPTRQRWRITGDESVTVDFLIQPPVETDKGGTLQNIEKDFAAFITPGLQLAFMDRRKVSITGKTPFGENASREVWTCGPGAYVVLKALAFRGRGENKDAYDLFYVVRNFGTGIDDVVVCLQPLMKYAETQSALDILREDFSAHDGLGPRRVAEFLHGGPDDETQAEVVSFVAQLLDGCGPPQA